MRSQRFKRLFQILYLYPIALVVLLPQSAWCQISISKSLSAVISDFDEGSIELYSFSSEDIEPDGWELSSSNTYNQSPFSLKVFGNTWKVQDIIPVMVNDGDVWQASAYIETEAEIQGMALMDGQNVLFYAFAGSEEVDIDEWIAVYQGCFPEDQWNVFQLPVARDWMARFGYFPSITSLVFINDKDDTSTGVFYIDNIIDITDDLPVAPIVEIDFITKGNKGNSVDAKAFEVQFNSFVDDPDSDEHTYHWDFGDGQYSNEKDPTHTYEVTDDHDYTVTLRVNDETDKYGLASTDVVMEYGATTFPVKLNFVGDIMLARRYEEWGGIIPTQGVEVIFEPTKPFLGEAADITIANLECPLTSSWEHHPTKSIYFKGSPGNIQGLTYAGIDVVSLANNHILDYMEQGLVDTRNLLDENNILHCGAGTNEYEASAPVICSSSGVGFAFLAACDRTGQYNNYQPFLHAGYNKPGFANLTEYNMQQQIEQVRDIADYVVLEWHAGIEYSLHPAGKTDGDIEADMNFQDMMAPEEKGRELRHAAIDYGADLIICHHPHVTQGVELYNGKLIAHSLGNFAFDQQYPETFPSMILNTEVDATGFASFDITPIYVDDYIPQRATGELGVYILDDLADRSRELDTYLLIDHDSIFASVLMDTVSFQWVENEHQVDLSVSNVNGEMISEPYRYRIQESISSVNNVQPSGNYDVRVGKQDVWFGNMEDEGCSLWDLNNDSESFCDTVYYGGERSLQHKRDENSPLNLITNLEKRLPCYPETKEYSLCGYIKTQNAKNVTIQVQYFADRTGSVLLAQEDLGASVNGDTPWTLYWKNLSIPADAKYYDIRFSSGVPDQDTAYSWFDDISIVSWTPWNEYAFGDQIPVPNNYYFVQTRTSEIVDEVTILYSTKSFYPIHAGTEDPDMTVEDYNDDISLFPNPFVAGFENGSITFKNPQCGDVVIAVFDQQGRKVCEPVNHWFIAGTHSVTWDGRNSSGEVLPPGLYVIHVRIRNIQRSAKCVIQ